MRIKNKNLMNMLKVIFSNLTLLLTGVVTSFVLPKILSVEGYGYYKIFNLYLTYVILLQFGIVEGIYIEYGGKKLSDIEQEEFSGYLKTLFVIQVALAGVIIVFSSFFLQSHLQFIGIALAVNVVIINLTNLYQYLSQAIEHFTELSVRNVIKSILMLVAVLIVYLMYRRFSYADYKLYVILLIAINATLLMWYLKTYKVISFGKGKIRLLKAMELIRIGFPLCMANIISSLILTLDRQVVSIFFSTTDYAIYSFAYSLLTLASTVVTSIAVVVFSMFKQVDEIILIDNYQKNIDLVSVLVCGMGTIYFPLNIFIRNYLPAYEGSLDIFRIIIPGLMISSSISIVMHNYYKVLNYNFVFLKKSVIILFVSFIANMIAFYLMGTMSSISYTSVLITVVWYVFTEKLLKEKYDISTKGNLLYLIIITIMFYTCSLFESISQGMLWYIIMYCLWTIISKKRMLAEYGLWQLQKQTKKRK